MLFTLSTTHPPATDLGFVLAKNPTRLHTFELPSGVATVFFPDATPERCTAALLVEVDVVGAARSGRHADSEPLARYVNDRGYAASSLLSVALGRVFGTAMAGRSRERPELAATPIPLVATIAALPARGGADLVRRLFEPLGYAVEVEGSGIVDVTLRGTARVADLLTHVYVLVPVLDDQKHYWVGDDEVEKLLANGGDWLAGHPERELVVGRYLRRRSGLVREALERLGDEAPPPLRDEAEERLEQTGTAARLVDLRADAVVEALGGLRTIADLGCGEGRLLGRLAGLPGVLKVLGLDVSVVSLQRAVRRVDALPPALREKVTLLHGSATFRDARLADLDGACLVEVIEHLDPDRLGDLEAAVFGAARPRRVVVTTPNAEANAGMPGLAPGAFRHADHRFEWDRAAFRTWASGVAERNTYLVSFSGVGADDPRFGPPTQLAVFERGAP